MSFRACFCFLAFMAPAVPFRRLSSIQCECYRNQNSSTLFLPPLRILKWPLAWLDTGVCDVFAIGTSFLIVIEAVESHSFFQMHTLGTQTSRLQYNHSFSTEIRTHTRHDYKLVAPAIVPYRYLIFPSKHPFPYLLYALTSLESHTPWTHVFQIVSPKSYVSCVLGDHHTKSSMAFLNVLVPTLGL